MTCIERRPRCGTATSESATEPIKTLAALVGTLSGAAGTIAGIIKGFNLDIIATVGGAASAGAIGGSLAAIAIIIIIGTYVADRCKPTKGLQECIAGVVSEIKQDFTDFLENLLPFTAMHDRVDVVVKSRYWDVVENGQAKVFCTDALPPSRSEIMRCYFFTERVCSAGRGAVVGAGIASVAAILAAVGIAAAIGCATIIFCFFALLLAVLAAAIITLVGALIGGQVAKALADDTSPTSNAGTVIQVGDLISVTGNMVRRDFDEGANVMWWSSNVSLSGRVPETVPRTPFSYCDIDDVFTTDSCPTV